MYTNRLQTTHEPHWDNQYRVSIIPGRGVFSTNHEAGTLDLLVPAGVYVAPVGTGGSFKPFGLQGVIYCSSNYNNSESYVTLHGVGVVTRGICGYFIPGDDDNSARPYHIYFDNFRTTNKLLVREVIVVPTNVISAFLALLARHISYEDVLAVAIAAQEFTQFNLSQAVQFMDIAEFEKMSKRPPNYVSTIFRAISNAKGGYVAEQMRVFYDRRFNLTYIPKEIDPFHAEIFFNSQ